MSTTTSTGRPLPKWLTPQKPEQPVLSLYNSLTKSKVELIPQAGKTLTWYNCGPTVYDASHMGHARTYLTIDILRRILEDYFNFDVLFVMNITDIDDKIILRARQNHLFDTYKASVKQLEQQVIEQVQAAWEAYATSKFGHLDAEVAKNWAAFEAKVAAKEITDADPKFPMNFTSIKGAYHAIQKAKQSLSGGDKTKESADELLDASQDVVSAWLDKEKGDSVTDPKVFRDLAAHWESEYMKDMEALNVKPCDVLTRVSEYVPEIVEYVQKIIDNGYGYEADGSVYFDTAAFDGHDEHYYAKLQPWSAGNTALTEEGEGSLGAKLTGKKNPSDFALWKKSKRGEPAWNSPWGEGRPGWHIECSVMASEVLGQCMDIHSGGIDLAFPHHDNELAQSEAYHGCKQWVNYFLHPGHLHIEGQKMSKSLKNFITIREALEKYTARQLRLFFLLHQWDSKIDYKISSMNEAVSIESGFNNFFANVKALSQEYRLHASESDGTHRFRDAERDMLAYLSEKQGKVHAALCDSINTPDAIQELLDLINKTNIYISAGRNKINVPVVEKIAKYITRIMKSFGLADDGQLIGFGSSGQGVANAEEMVMPYLRSLSRFRDNVREMARNQKPHSEFLVLSDKLRDDDMVELGVALDDQEDGRALVKLVDREELIRAREFKKQREQEKAAKKAALQKAQELKRQEKLAKGKLAPEVMFKQGEYQGLFGQYDEEGFPTHDINGEELPKSRRKKLTKEFENQKKLHQEYLASLN
ncbi:cysteinyl-tRNA synthetase [Basidiobolus meristosporus CBS 931.73]|uniref:cysteine--tRNA ligase n=1 Tax=Basidiobolus meristosporus CBS 931.73 TaxID=1314790 RepID=A0A1Y1XWN3_9FUNG|nr:cysteinyl-tRNA synthetase [Basidiobolus meristosporus CBS 931.73]|eukprot:ORX90132.1 cysteinyl-tRNA synthetase [Basidiobolus meristosporus CBS 931.73]